MGKDLLRLPAPAGSQLFLDQGEPKSNLNRQEVMIMVYSSKLLKDSDSSCSLEMVVAKLSQGHFAPESFFIGLDIIGDMYYENA
jgi:hypothetical protein